VIRKQSDYIDFLLILGKTEEESMRQKNILFMQSKNI